MSKAAVVMMPTGGVMAQTNITVTLSEEQYKAVRHASGVTGKSESDVIKSMVSDAIATDRPFSAICRIYAHM